MQEVRHAGDVSIPRGHEPVRRRGAPTTDVSLADALAATYLPFEFRSRHATLNRHARIAIAELRCGDIRIVQSISDPWRGRRGRASADQDKVIVALVLRGHAWFAHGSDETRIGPGDVAVLDGARTVEAEVVSQLHKLAVVLPRWRLADLDDELPGPRPFGAPGVRLLHAHMRQLVAEIGSLTGPQQRAAAAATVEMARLALWPGPDSAEQRPRDVLVRDVRRWVDGHLLEDALSPTTIAEEHGVSVRTLHDAFARTGETVSGMIRRRRLEEARRQLSLDPTVQVAEVARRCGFQSPAHFTTRFRRQFGVTPTNVRDAARSGSGR